MTIQELSQELNISAQALRQWCKKNNVRKERTQGKKATYVLDCDTVTKAKAYYLSESKESNETKEEKQRKESKESSKNDIEIIQSDYIATLKAQLAEKDKQIESLLEQMKAKEEQLAQLNDKLTAAQALHAGTTQALLQAQKAQTETATQQTPERPAAASETSRTTSEPRPAQRPRSERQQPHRKQSMLDSLLKAFRIGVKRK